jgi:ATP-dependent Clp protease ATP-binding subunit ClpC
VTLSATDLRHTDAALAVALRRIFFRPLSIALYALILSPFLAEEFLKHDLRPAGIVAALILGWLWVLHRYIVSELKPTIGALKKAKTLADQLSYHMVQHLSTKSVISPTSIIEAAMESDRGLFVLLELGLERKTILDVLQKNPLQCTLDTCLQWITDAVTDLGTERLDSTATIYAFLTHVTELQSLVSGADLSQEDLKNILRAEAFHFYLHERKHHWLSPESLVRTMGSLGRSWVIGYNTALERLTKNISENILSQEHSIVIHRDILQSTAQAFAGGTGTNLLLLGSAGTGKRSLVRNLAFLLRRREIERGEAFTDVLLLKTALLLSGSAQSDRDFLKALDDTSQGGRFILVIEDAALLLKAADPRLKDILVNMLQSKNVRVICITDTADYHTLIKTDPLVDNLFQKVYLEDASDVETMAVLLEEYFSVGHKRRFRMTYRALKVLLDLSKQYIGRGGLPGKAVDTLRETMAAARGSGKSSITETAIRDVISRKSRVDVRALSENAKDVLLHLKERLQERIIGQEHALDSLVAALKRGKVNLETRKRPIGTFLFLGTTGVGKTETAKAIAEVYFGSPESFIRVDMNELSDENGIRTLIGGPTNNGFTEGFLTKRVLDRPFSLILLDEIEKAHPKVLHLLLQVLDEGTLIDGQGMKTDFRNTIIIATSNAGTGWLKEHQMSDEEKLQDTFRAALIDVIIAEHAFSPEFINRFDEVILFSSPTQEEVRKLAILMLGSIIKDIETQRGIHITVEPTVIDLLVKLGYSPEFGAREMRRSITQTIENYLADTLLTHTVKRGETIEIQKENLKA